MLFSLALVVAFTSFLFNWQADQSALTEFSNRGVETQNWLSKFGATISDFFIYQGFGVAAYDLAFLLGLTGVYLFFDFNRKRLLNFWFWGIFVMLWLSVAFGFLEKKGIEQWTPTGEWEKYAFPARK